MMPRKVSNLSDFQYQEYGYDPDSWSSEDRQQVQVKFYAPKKVRDDLKRFADEKYRSTMGMMLQNAALKYMYTWKYSEDLKTQIRETILEFSRSFGLAYNQLTQLLEKYGGGIKEQETRMRTELQLEFEREQQQRRLKAVGAIVKAVAQNEGEQQDTIIEAAMSITDDLAPDVCYVAFKMAVAMGLIHNIDSFTFLDPQ